MAKKIQVIYKDITFDSKLECDIYKKLESDEDIEIIDIHKEFTLSDKIEYHDILINKKRILREAKYTTDFIIKMKNIDKPLAIEVKGFRRPEYMVRKKRFISKYHDDYYFIEIGSIKDYEMKFSILKER